MSIPDFENVRQIVTYFQTISLPESCYLCLEKWHVYIIALIGIVTLGILFYMVHLLFKLFFFRYVFNSQDASLATLHVSYLFFVYAIVFIVFGFVWGFFGLSIPDKFGSMKLMLVFGILTVVLGLIRLFKGMDYDSVFHSGSELILKLLNVVVVVGLCFTISFMALCYASLLAPSDSSVIYGHVFADVNSEYKIGDTASIPVKIGGPDSGLSVFLLHDELDGLKQISSLCLYSNNSSTQFNDTLIGNTRGTGNYIIFLNNTTSLPSGHYRLMFENPKYEWINLSSPFFLSPK